jgi:ribose transport system permease protein
MNRTGFGLKKIYKWSALPALFLMALAFIIISFTDKVSSSYIGSFLSTNTAVICVGIGASVVIISGGIDISLGALVSLCNVVAVQLMMNGVPYYWAVLLVLIMSVAAGALNGLIVSVLKIPALLATYATQTMFAGLALLVMKTPGGKIAKELVTFFYTKLFGVIPMAALFILVPIVVWKLYKRSPAGIGFYALGCNETKAYLSGINVRRHRMFAYCFAGFATGVGALAMTCYVGAGDPDIGTSLIMTAISAAVIGGVSLSGGYGDVAGGIFGCIFFGLLTNMIVGFRVDAFSQNLLKAVILLLGVLSAISVVRKDSSVGGGIARGRKIKGQH